ncbi:hypothetical protein, partial [Frankia sp. CcWB3]
WIPRYVAADPEELADAPPSLRTLLRFMAESGLRDPRGASVEENEAAIVRTAAEFPAALADPDRRGIPKFWDMTVRDTVVEIIPPAVPEHFKHVLAGLAGPDDDLLDQLMSGQFAYPGPVPERTIAQLPVSLPPAEELAEAAGRSQVVGQLRAFVAWVGTDGRPLTAAGNLRPADARELVDLLDTGEQGLRVRSTAELPHLNLIFTWAKKTRLVRVSRTKLVAVAKARPLLKDAEALWQRAFETFFELRDAVCLPIWTGSGTSLLYDVYAEAVPDMLNTIYSLPDPMPMACLEEAVWQSCRQQFRVDAGSPLQQGGWRTHLGRDIKRVFDVLAALGAVERTRGLADEKFIATLADDVETPFAVERSISGPAAARLRAELAQPTELVALTALGTRAMRGRLLAEGREAGLVGDLATAQPAELLGVIAEHYTRETGNAEITNWLAGHGGDVEPLLDAVRVCPFRTRAAAMLNVLTSAVPAGAELLDGLRDDPVLAPLAVTALLDRGALQPEDLTDREQALVMTEGFLQLLEMGGPEVVREQIEEMAGDLAGLDFAELLAIMRGCGHPGAPTLRDFQALVVDPG